MEFKLIVLSCIFTAQENLTKEQKHVREGPELGTD